MCKTRWVTKLSNLVAYNLDKKQEKNKMSDKKENGEFRVLAMGVNGIFEIISTELWEECLTVYKRVENQPTEIETKTENKEEN
jgi:hypothetical protein